MVVGISSIRPDRKLLPEEQLREMPVLGELEIHFLWHKWFEFNKLGPSSSYKISSVTETQIKPHNAEYIISTSPFYSGLNSLPIQGYGD